MATRTVAESREERKRASEAAKEAMQEAASYAATELAAARARCGPDSDLAKRWAMRPCRGERLRARPLPAPSKAGSRANPAPRLGGVRCGARQRPTFHAVLSERSRVRPASDLLSRISHHAASRCQKSSWFQEVDRDANDHADCRLRWPCPRGSFGPVYTRAVYTRAVRAHAPSTVGPAMLSVASTRTCPLCTTGPKSSAIITAPGEKCGLLPCRHRGTVSDEEMVARGRIELPTRGFSVHCSTD